MFSPVGESAETAGYWLSDIVCTKNMDATEILPGAGMDVFVWAVQLVDGEILSWCVPYICDYHSEVREHTVLKHHTLGCLFSL